MKAASCRILMALIVSGMLISAASAEQPIGSVDPNSTPETYGSIAVTRVLRVDRTCTLYCDIDSFPPVLGKNIPVCLEGVELPETGGVDGALVAYLEQVLLTSPKSESAPPVVLHNIRRGPTFSLIAAIEVNGQDLAGLLVDRGLARRIIRLGPAAVEQTPAGGTPAGAVRSAGKPAAVSGSEYVASKSSKIFHRSACPHAKRIDPAGRVAFRTRQEAQQNGRRPCKTCNP